eukprot:353989-Amphidinium_carterae.1
MEDTTMLTKKYFKLLSCISFCSARVAPVGVWFRSSALKFHKRRFPFFGKIVPSFLIAVHRMALIVGFPLQLI